MPFGGSRCILVRAPLEPLRPPQSRGGAVPGYAAGYAATGCEQRLALHLPQRPSGVAAVALLPPTHTTGQHTAISWLAGRSCHP